MSNVDDIFNRAAARNRALSLAIDPPMTEEQKEQLRREIEAMPDLPEDEPNTDDDEDMGDDWNVNEDED